jgi:ribonuclease HII
VFATVAKRLIVILAKTLRDYLMERLSSVHPEYGWETNAGYGTPAHLNALQRHGPTRHHRYSFAPVSQLSLPLGVRDVGTDP